VSDFARSSKAAHCSQDNPKAEYFGVIGFLAPDRKKLRIGNSRCVSSHVTCQTGQCQCQRKFSTLRWVNTGVARVVGECSRYATGDDIRLAIDDRNEGSLVILRVDLRIRDARLRDLIRKPHARKLRERSLTIKL